MATVINNSASSQIQYKLEKVLGDWHSNNACYCFKTIDHGAIVQDKDVLEFLRAPSLCACGSKSSVEHALSHPKSGFPLICHNKIRDLTANLLTEVCNNACIEPILQPTDSGALTGSSSNTQDGARVDISANGFWGGRFERTFFNVRVFNPRAPSNRKPRCYRKLEKKNSE